MILVNCFRCCKNYGRQPQQARIPEAAHPIDARAKAAAANSFSATGNHQPHASLRHRGSVGLETESKAAAGAGAAAEASVDENVISEIRDLVDYRGITFKFFENFQDLIFYAMDKNNTQFISIVKSNDEHLLYYYKKTESLALQKFSHYLYPSLYAAVEQCLNEKFPVS